MHLDLQTLSVVTVFITALLGAFLVFAGLQNRSVRAPIWWGAAHIVNACGFALLTARDSAPEFVTIDRQRLVLFGYGLTWTGARVFDGRNISPSSCWWRRDVARAVPISGLRRRCRRENRRRFDHAGGAGVAHRRGILARPRRTADVALALRRRAASSMASALLLRVPAVSVVRASQRPMLLSGLSFTVAGLRHAACSPSSWPSCSST